MWNKNNELPFLVVLCLCCYSELAVADQVYLRTLSLVDTIVSIFFAVAHIVGAIFMFMGIVYYRRFRQNPVETPLSKVLWISVLGVVLFCFPWAAEQLSIYQTIEQASQQVPA